MRLQLALRQQLFYQSIKVLSKLELHRPGLHMHPELVESFAEERHEEAARVHHILSRDLVEESGPLSGAHIRCESFHADLHAFF